MNKTTVTIAAAIIGLGIITAPTAGADPSTAPDGAAGTPGGTPTPTHQTTRPAGTSSTGPSGVTAPNGASGTPSAAGGSATPSNTPTDAFSALTEAFNRGLLFIQSGRITP